MPLGEEKGTEMGGHVHLRRLICAALISSTRRGAQKQCRVRACAECHECGDTAPRKNLYRENQTLVDPAEHRSAKGKEFTYLSCLECVRTYSSSHLHISRPMMQCHMI